LRVEIAPRTRRCWHWVLSVVVLCIVSCAATPSLEKDAQALKTLIAAEGEAARAHDAERLASLWAEDGVVRDARHTPGDPSDDGVWQGRDAIMSRYTSTIFYLTLEEMGPIDLAFDIRGDQAVVTGTTRIGDEVSPGGERWTFARQDGEWVIKGITFNLEAGGQR
jgi:ketosteroid isomerase-like protein